MILLDMLLPEYDRELGTTRRLIERTPEADFSWKPHPDAWTLHELVAHLSHILYWGEVTLTTDSFDQETAVVHGPALTMTDMLERFDRQVRATRLALASQSNAGLTAPWTLSRGGELLFTVPRITAFRSLVMNHLIHHRGQLSVYLQERNVAMPICGDGMNFRI